MCDALLTINYDCTRAPDDEADVFDIADNNVPELREFNAFRKFCAERRYAQYNYSGIVSAKFTTKTGLSKSQALATIDRDADIVLFHPYPLELSVQSDFLQLAEMEHPDLRSRMRELWRKLFDSELPTLSLPEQRLYCCHCNYFVASSRFWEDYSRVIARLDELHLSGELAMYLSDTVTYHLRTDADRMVPYFPFMFERLLSHYLYARRDVLTVVNVSMDPDFQPISLFPGERWLVAALRCLRPDAHRGQSGAWSKIPCRVYYLVRRFAFGVRRLVQ